MEDETVEVKEGIYKAAMAFDGLCEGDGFMLAEMIEGHYTRAGDEQKRKHWRAITDYLKCREFVGMGTRVIIIPD